MILPEGFFSNEHDEALRKYVAKYCKVLVSISLPRGVFRKGRDVKGKKYKGQKASMKMSILYVEKIRGVVDKDDIDLSGTKLNYPVFLAIVSEPKSKEGEISTWLKPRLNAVLKEWNN